MSKRTREVSLKGFYSHGRRLRPRSKEASRFGPDGLSLKGAREEAGHIPPEIALWILDCASALPLGPQEKRQMLKLLASLNKFYRQRYSDALFATIRLNSSEPFKNLKDMAPELRAGVIHNLSVARSIIFCDPAVIVDLQYALEEDRRQAKQFFGGVSMCGFSREIVESLRTAASLPQEHPERIRTTEALLFILRTFRPIHVCLPLFSETPSYDEDDWINGLHRLWSDINFTWKNIQSVTFHDAWNDAPNWAAVPLQRVFYAPQSWPPSSSGKRSRFSPGYHITIPRRVDLSLPTEADGFGSDTETETEELKPHSTLPSASEDRTVDATVTANQWPVVPGRTTLEVFEERTDDWPHRTTEFLNILAFTTCSDTGQWIKHLIVWNAKQQQPIVVDNQYTKETFKFYSGSSGDSCVCCGRR